MGLRQVGSLVGTNQAPPLESNGECKYKCWGMRSVQCNKRLNQQNQFKKTVNNYYDKCLLTQV